MIGRRGNGSVGPEIGGGGADVGGRQLGRRVLRPLLALMVALAGFTGVAIGSASPAAALCSSSGPQGDWRNINPNTTAMTRVVVETCQWVTTCSGGICSGNYGGTFLTPYGKCHPTDCNWGRVRAEHLSDGWMRTIHNFGFKSSQVWAKTYEYYGRTYLRVWVYNDFAPTDGRSDYTTDEWFLR